MSRLESLAPGVWRLPLRTPTLPPATHTNLMIVGQSRLALVEPATPFAEERRVVDETLEAMAAEGRRVELLLVTHHHVDHIGDVERLRQRLGVPLAAHARTAVRLPFAVDRELRDGEEIDLDALALREPSVSETTEDGNPTPPDLPLEDYFRHFVERNQGQMSETELADRLGISRKALWERRQRLGLERPRKSRRK